MTKLENKTISQLKKDCWKVFSLFVRLRDMNKETGLCTCITCPKQAIPSEMQAGHGIGGRHNYLLFNEKICNAQCPYCNIWSGGQYEKYAVVLIKRHGLKWYEKMTKYVVKQFTKKELIDMIAHYKKEVEKLLEKC